MRIPRPRGPVSTELLNLMAHWNGPEAGDAAQFESTAEEAVVGTPDILRDGDLQLALFCLYELHYSGLEGVDASWEWHPGLIKVRQRLEASFEDALRSSVSLPALDQLGSDGVAAALFTMASADNGPSMSRYIAKKASLEQLREFLILKSIYQLKEADPHTWAIPRLNGRAKAAMVEIQADEYGGGRPERMHSVLFARTMDGLQMDTRYGAYIDRVPALTLSANNMMSLFGLNRRLRGAIAGHLAAYEMTSSQPNRLYGNGFRRHGFDEGVTWYFDEHVEADAVHEQIAGRDLAGGLVEAEPDLLEDVYFGAAAALAVDVLLATDVMECWESGVSALLPAGN